MSRRDPDINENYLHDEYTDDELNEQSEARYDGITGPFDPGVNTGGTLAGEAVDTGDRSSGEPRERMVTGWDSDGNPVPQDPALAGTVAGNTNAALPADD